jgi:hypothetical protein
MTNYNALGHFIGKMPLEKCRSYVLSQLLVERRPEPARGTTSPGPAITIAHQTGSGAHDIAERLTGLLQADEPEGAAQWTAFDRQLVEKVLEEHHLPKALSVFVPEDRRSYVEVIMEELLGMHPPSWVMVPQIAETVLHLAGAGHVILVGRGANFITARMPNVFHVHLIAPLPTRIERLRRSNDLTPAEAAKLIKKEDRGSGRYAKTHFHASVDDDSLYHLVINTDRMSSTDAAQLIAYAARMSWRAS